MSQDNRSRFALIQERADLSRVERNFGYAFHLYEQALDVARKMHDSERECQTLIDLAKTADILDKTEDANDFFQQALEIAQKKRAFRTQRLILGERGFISLRTGDLHHSAENFSQAVDTHNIAKPTTIIVREEKAVVRTVDQVQDSPTRSSSLSPALQEIKQVERIRTLGQRIRVVSIFFLIVIVILCIYIYLALPKNLLTIGLLLILLCFLVILYFFNNFFGEDKEE